MFLNSGNNLASAYAECTLVTIATILGTGILGLPSTMAYSGFVPFLGTFLVNFFVQTVIVVLFTEVMVLCRNEETLEFIEMPINGYDISYQNEHLGKQIEIQIVAKIINRENFINLYHLTYEIFKFYGLRSLADRS